MPLSSSPHFPHAYEVNYHGFQTNGDDCIKRKFIYSFDNFKQQKYIIHIEEYDYKVFVLKFYLKSFEYSKRRYTHLTNNKDAFRILSTCFIPILHIRESIDANASFGFLGARKPKDNSDANTQRYRVYALKGKTFFSVQKFIHLENPKNSSYLILDKSCHNETTIPKVQEMFDAIYENLQ